jgi:hypothetical protein
MPELDSLIRRNGLDMAAIYEARLALLGTTGVIIPLGDYRHGKPDATTLTTVGDQQLTGTWSEAPFAFDTPLNLTNDTSWQGAVPLVTFNGSDEFLTIASAIISDYPFSMEVWDRSTSFGTDVTLALQDASENNVYYFIGHKSGGVPTVRVRNTTEDELAGSTNKFLNTWNHTVGVFTNATSREIYLNGVSGGTDTTSVALGSVDRVTVARWRGSSEGFDFVGDMAGGALGPAITEKALSLDEVKRLYNLGRAALGI